MRRLFQHDFVAVFDAHHARLFRYLDRLSGDPDLAADLAQEAFMKLFQRGSLPDSPGAWLVTVATNALRNTQTTRQRRANLLKAVPDASSASDAAARERARRVRAALDAMPERERRLLLLRAEGYSYREMAVALDMNEASMGTLLARARKAFRAHYEGGDDAPH